jgi:hypothetical protein
VQQGWCMMRVQQVQCCHISFCCQAQQINSYLLLSESIHELYSCNIHLSLNKKQKNTMLAKQKQADKNKKNF